MQSSEKDKNSLISEIPEPSLAVEFLIKAGFARDAEEPHHAITSLLVSEMIFKMQGRVSIAILRTLAQCYESTGEFELAKKYHQEIVDLYIGSDNESFQETARVSERWLKKYK